MLHPTPQRDSPEALCTAPRGVERGPAPPLTDDSCIIPEMLALSFPISHSLTPLLPVPRPSSRALLLGEPGERQDSTLLKYKTQGQLSQGNARGVVGERALPLPSLTPQPRKDAISLLILTTPTWEALRL